MRICERKRGSGSIENPQREVLVASALITTVEFPSVFTRSLPLGCARDGARLRSKTSRENILACGVSKRPAPLASPRLRSGRRSTSLEDLAGRASLLFKPSPRPSSGERRVERPHRVSHPNPGRHEGWCEGYELDPATGSPGDVSIVGCRWRGSGRQGYRLLHPPASCADGREEG